MLFNLRKKRTTFPMISSVFTTQTWPPPARETALCCTNVSNLKACVIYIRAVVRLLGGYGCLGLNASFSPNYRVKGKERMKSRSKSCVRTVSIVAKFVLLRHFICALTCGSFFHNSTKLTVLFFQFIPQQLS